MRRSPLGGLKSIVFRLGVLFHRRFGLPILPGTPRRARSGLHRKSKKALSTFLRAGFPIRCQSTNDFTRERKEERGKRRKKEGSEGKTQTLSLYSCQLLSSFLYNGNASKRTRLSLLADNLSNCYRFLCAASYFCFRGPRRGSFISLMFAKGVTKWRISCFGVEVSGSVKQ